MAAFSLDSSCMVAAICSWHEQHTATVAAIERRLDRGDRLCVAAHALAEAFVVLTRLPAPHRLSPADAWAFIKANFVEGASVTALNGAGYVAVLDRLAESGAGGGAAFDVVTAVSTSHAGADTLLTLNPKQFDPAPPGVAIVDPSR